MATQRYTFNAFETELASGITAVSDTISLVSVIGLRAPGYLVIDPEDPNLREYIGFDGISSNDLIGAASYRGLGGSVASAQAHDAGAKVRAVAMHQMWDDVWENVNQNESDIGDGQTALTTHINNPSDPHAAAGYVTDADLTAHIDDASDPHAAAGYLTETDADALYVEVGGDTMTGPLVLDDDPTADLGAATKQYVDDAVGIPNVQLYSNPSRDTIPVDKNIVMVEMSDGAHSVDLPLSADVPNGWSILVKTFANGSNNPGYCYVYPTAPDELYNYQTVPGQAQDPVPSSRINCGFALGSQLTVINKKSAAHRGWYVVAHNFGT